MGEYEGRRGRRRSKSGGVRRVGRARRKRGGGGEDAKRHRETERFLETGDGANVDEHDGAQDEGESHELLNDIDEDLLEIAQFVVPGEQCGRLAEEGLSPP